MRENLYKYLLVFTLLNFSSFVFAQQVVTPKPARPFSMPKSVGSQVTSVGNLSKTRNNNADTQKPIARQMSSVENSSKTRSYNTNSKQRGINSLSPDLVNEKFKNLKNALKENNEAEAYDWGPYMRNLQRNIKVNWNPPKESETKRSTLKFRIMQDGTLSSVSVYKSSNDEEYDEASIKAVKDTVFEPLPIKLSEGYVDIQFTFDYNVMSCSKSKK